MRFLPLLFGLCLLLVGCASGNRDLWPPLQAVDNPSIFIVDHGRHTGIVVDRKRAAKDLPVLSGEFSESRFLEIGWGDFDYYQADDPGSYTTFKAVFIPTDSALHVVGFDEDPEEYFTNDDFVELKLSQAGFKKILKFINQTFKLDSEEQVIKLGKSLYDDGRFYHANGAYIICDNCNTWTGDACQDAGIPVSTCCLVTSKGLLEQLKQILKENNDPEQRSRNQKRFSHRATGGTEKKKN